MKYRHIKQLYKDTGAMKLRKHAQRGLRLQQRASWKSLRGQQVSSALALLQDQELGLEPEGDGR